MNFFKKHKKLSIWVSAFVFVAAVIVFKELFSAIPGILAAIGKLLSILAPFVAGFVIAFILYVPCKKLENLWKKIKKPAFFSKHARGISVFTVYISFIIIITVILILIAPWLSRNLIKLYDNRHEYYETVMNFINSKTDEEGKLFGLLNISSLVEMINPERLFSGLNIEKLTSLASGVYKFGSIVVDVILAIFSSVYMLLSRSSLIRSFGHFCTLFAPKMAVKKAYLYLRKIANIFYSYIYSALIDALIVGSACSIAFLIIGIDYAPLFGFAIGIANLIPYFGAIIAGVVVSVFTAVTGGFIKAIIVAVCILVIQQIDANVLQPRIIGQNVGIQPLLTLVAITVGGGIMGFWGVILGVPIAATLQMIVTDILEVHDKKVAIEANETAGADNDTETGANKE